MAPSGATPRVLLAAGGTGGHLFPAAALAAALSRRGIASELATDERATRYGGDFPEAVTHVIPSATLTSRNPIALARTGALLGAGVVKAYQLLGRLRPAAVIGFGGYPTIPPVFAATLRRIPSVIHDANGVMGRANRLLASRVTAIATGFSGVVDASSPLARKTTVTGNPVRPAVLAAAGIRYVAPEPDGALRILVFGGSQGARIMAEIVPPAIERLEPTLHPRLLMVQQTREEDLPRVRGAYERLGVSAEIAPFFSDLPERSARAHLVVSRSGASTVAELSVIGRPAILVPLPHALDQDQLANATVLMKAGGAILMKQDAFTPDALAAQIAELAAEPRRLGDMASAARSIGIPEAAERLAELVMKVGGLEDRHDFQQI